ncbi:MAG: hypothetical protein M3Z08_13510 [Chloroflexota bacterium]|nr:hypothetical protein [Chloroflexota bacterium]
MHFLRSKLSIAFSIVALAVVITGLVAAGAIATSRTTHGATKASATHMHVNCQTSPQCTEVQDSEEVFGEGHYVGHDEPSTLFYSNKAGSGNENRWQLTLPKDPSPANPTTPSKSYNFELHPAFWFGMAMCDTQSYPEQVSTCAPDSDKNIVDPAISPVHPGTAFTEMQFYPPGWTAWPAGVSCDPTKWCAALNIDSLSENPVTGQLQNPTCQAQAGLEYVNFAFITRNGVSQAPANPVQSTLATFTPDPTKDLFMKSGDQLAVTMRDTAHGLQIIIKDKTTGQNGSMTASAANGFGQVGFDPTGTSCNNIPYDFHPMYSTSSEKTRVTWAAHSYNVAFADEIGHFDFCSTVTTGTCTGTEGNGANQEPSDVDDTGCFPASASTRVQVSGCIGTNNGFDGVPYTPVWPDGNTKLHPTSILFTSPVTGSNYGTNYDRVAFEADLPRIEASVGACDRSTGNGCTLIPPTDDCTAGPPVSCAPAQFYPFFSIRKVDGTCVWQLGNHIPGSTNDFRQNQQYGTLLNLNYTGLGGGTVTRYNDFRQVLSHNPCQP